MLASAPGKVLILGGYLIVASPNVGVSIGVNARFTTRIVKWQPSTRKEKSTIRIASPQFHQEYTFECELSTTGGDAINIVQTSGIASDFLFYAVLYAFTAARVLKEDMWQDLSVELNADNDFYSQRNYLEDNNIPVTVESLRALPKQLPLVGAVSKTGLGSSAALTTSVVACVLSHLLNKADVDPELIHRVAQVAHSVSQGKIGSGFDVYTAVYGTCAYRRFPATNVEAIMEPAGKPARCFVKRLEDIIDAKVAWVKSKPFRLPHGFHLVLGDVHMGGSSTPDMVSRIMAWKKSVADKTDNLWERLRSNNEAYIEHLDGLRNAAVSSAEAYNAAIAQLKGVHLQSHTPVADVERRIIEASRVAARSRQYLREMGVAASVEVEPKVLTQLLDDTAVLPGVFAVGCPGAGGYDAVFALVLGDEGNCRAVESFWEAYKELSICPLLVREDPRGLVVEKAE